MALVDDWLLAADGALAPFGRPTRKLGRLGNWLTVNGRPVPEAIQAAPGERVRLRSPMRATRGRRGCASTG